MTETSSAAVPDASDLMRAARQQTGLHDFGEPEVSEALRVQIDCFNRDARLTPAGAAAQQMNFSRLLTNRLRLQQLHVDHPEIAAEKIRGPIVIVGLPRSGTTKLQRMMAADPALQKIPFWRMLNPLPLEGEKPGDPTPRIAIAEAATAYTKANFPNFAAAHPMSATDAEEEDFLMEHSFYTSVTYSSHRMPGFMKWALSIDPRPYYDQLKRFLQQFQWEDHAAGRMWLIKATCHLHRLPWLFEVFPDATVVHCHRNPVTSLASLADMFYTVRCMCSDQADPIEVGDFTLDYSRRQLQDYLEQRAVLEQKHRFIDVAFNDIVARPMSLIEEIYAAVNMELTDTARAAMQAWEADNPQHKHGKRDYRAEKFGYTESRLREGMAHYIDRFSTYM